MADIYVDPATGDDGDTGGSGDPFATLQTAIDNATGGDTIHIANTAAETMSSAIDWGTGFGSTSDTSFLTIQAWDNGGSLVMPHPAGDIDCARLDINNVGDFWDNATSNVILKNIEMLNVGDGGTNYGIRFWQSWMLYRCHIKGPGGTSGSNRNLINMASTRCKLLECWLEVDSPSGSVTAVLMGQSDQTIAGCWIHGSSNWGLSSGNQGQIFNNVIFDNDTGGIEADQDDINIFNNTIVGNGSSGEIGIEHTSSSNRASIWNNIIANFDGTSAVGIQGNGTTSPMFYGHNHFHNNTTDESGVSPWIDLGGEDQTTDPGFASEANQDFSVGTNGKAHGWPTGFLGSSDGANAGTQTFVDIGAAQREEPSGGGGGGLLRHPGMLGGLGG